MLHAAGALRLAVDLLHQPSQGRSVRSAPLPGDMLVLLRIAAGDEEVISQAAESAGRSRDVIREAAAFFIEQIMLYPEADSYRVLGATPEAPHPELRRNMALLLRWLHPDSDRQDQRVVFAARVTRAWNDLKTTERRAAYDRLRLSKAKRSVLSARQSAHIPSNRHRPYGNARRPYSAYDASFGLMRMYSNRGRELLRRVLLRLFDRSAL